MKRVVIFFFAFFAFIPFVSASCTNYYDDGNDAATFGYVVANDVTYVDTCTSSTQLKEYYCSGTSLASSTNTCGSCHDGVCYSSTCSTSEECNPVLRSWCSGSSWSTSGYCTDSHLQCYLVDSTCAASTCTEGACDYQNHKYCSGNSWISTNYCDTTHCGSDTNSRGYCFCADTTDTTETSCTDNKDNDCDGSVDCNDSDCAGQAGCLCTDGESQSCSTDVGACTLGTQMCSGGNWGTCSGVGPSTELCDGIDNNCDGEIDENCTCVPGDTRDCGANVGVCKAGIQICQSDATWSVCYGASYAASEIEQCNGVDDDCDGLIDEGCSCVAGTNQSCGSDVGACQVGLQSCVNGTWTECNGDIAPFPEICGDGIDNDCDGLVDSQDDTCAEANVTLTNISIGTTNITVNVTVQCTQDSDCDSGYVCTRAQCVKEIVTESSSSSLTSKVNTTALISSDLSSLQTSSSPASDLWVYALLIFFFLFLLGFLFWYLQKRKRLSSTKTSPQKSQTLLKTVSSPSFPMPFAKTPPKKGFVDKELEASFKESSQLFRK